MKKSILNLTLIVFALFTTAFMTGCGQSQKNDKEEVQATEETQPAPETKEVAYACPMHPDITGKEGDKCSKCGMDLEPVEDTADSVSTQEM